jgi:hypothetical protein
MSEISEQQRPEDVFAAAEAAREANVRIAEKAQRLRFVARVPFVCECSDPDCREFVLLLPHEYQDARGHGYVTRPGHEVADAEPSARDDFWLHAVRDD